MNNIQTIMMKLDELYAQLRILVAQNSTKATQEMLDVTSQIQQLTKQL